MYIGIKSWLMTPEAAQELKKYLLSTEIVQKADDRSSVLKIDLKSLRKFKIISLNNQEIKDTLTKVQKILNDESLITIYGEELPPSGLSFTT